MSVWLHVCVLWKLLRRLWHHLPQKESVLQRITFYTSSYDLLLWWTELRSGAQSPVATPSRALRRKRRQQPPPWPQPRFHQLLAHLQTQQLQWPPPPPGGPRHLLTLLLMPAAGAHLTLSCRWRTVQFTPSEVRKPGQAEIWHMTVPLKFWRFD